MSDSSVSVAARADAASSTYAWYVVGVLMFAYIVSGIDRIAISFLVGPIKETFALSDFEMGLLMGPAFGIFYALFGVPIGWLADFKSRKAIVLIGIVVWCTMTMLCGLAGSFWLLFAARIGVGIGEATLSPCALSLISDYHARQRRALAVSVYMVGSFLGASLAFLTGAHVVEMISGWQPWSFGDLGTMEPWRTTFIVVGAGGLVAALLVATLREPERTERIAGGGAPSSIGEALRFLRTNWRGIGLLILAMGCVFALGYTSFWMLELFERTWHWSAAQTGTAFAVLVAVSAIGGTQLGGRLGDAWSRRGLSDGPLRAALLGAVIALPGYCLSPLMPTGGWAIALMTVAMLGQAMASACAPVAIINAVPSELRGKMSALYFTIASLIGLLIGPPSVGWASDLIGGTHGLRYGLTIVSVVFSVLSVALLMMARRQYASSVEALERRLGLRPASLATKH